MRICLDLDGVICQTKKSGENYSDVLPIHGAIEAIQKLRDQGHYIIISTSRHMKTCNHNIGQVIAKQGKTIIEWLEKYGVIYDELYFGKPLYTVMIDDHSLKFEGNWDKILEELSKIEDHLKE